jgi:predicted  nucleic acid-binding Zn-ribbon protein
METKEELVTSIKEWIKMDTEISQLKTEIKNRKNKQKQLSESLMEVMKKNEIDCFDITGGSLVYKKNTVKKPINAKTLITTLKSYFETAPSKAEELTKFILDNREEQVKETIKRKIDK